MYSEGVVDVIVGVIVFDCLPWGLGEVPVEKFGKTPRIVLSQMALGDTLSAEYMKPMV
jgi:hypothetical protein